ncbi:hypothetical protein FA13DRAFT_1796939 [Coprinellus micaceus]|uniref:Uncharacterized protein n=1 Tax=Coprinellus micaceus TaxID=71717 RepID=A0A4Y7SU06_COPMI|nr:hypothetical protein FA13DRAFT_1796939 [Coprinellus micaceus]
MPLTPDAIYKYIVKLSFRLPDARRQVEAELEALTREDPVAGISLQEQVRQNWGTMDLNEAFWIAIFGWGNWNEMNLHGGFAKYPKLELFFKTYVIRALLVVCYRHPAAIIALTLLLNDIPLAHDDQDDFEERWPIIVARRRAVVRWRYEAGESARIVTQAEIARFGM